ncbi:alpha/beta hydrolase [Cyanobium sp. NIES-981]|uniref:alpha/beta hydrolase n=1 Tax=Cyanobium sp. NIES-981 TaxID=1851505 RepID=UPI0007DD2EEE|nr:alpha/beta hydrolase [Cyanobium sp. NIES-981]SBO44606.1 Alpha/beta hydrolase family protein [Cyanobium sp. NIES-981]
MQVIAMHGWCGIGRAWAPMAEAARRLGWSWQSGERGYGSIPPMVPGWRGGSPRVVIAHSLGPHLLPAAVLEQADTVVLLASFGRFVPEGAAGRPVRRALEGMERCLRGVDPTPMLQSFLERAADPQPWSALPETVLDEPLRQPGLQRLLQDLQLLAHCRGLPAGFPVGARCLIVEAGADRIVAPEARQKLRVVLPGAEHLLLPDAGHALLVPDLGERVLGWIGSL